MRCNFVKKTKGFTLIEVIIYTGLSTLVISSLLAIAFPLIDGAGAISQKTIEETEAAFILQKISYALKSGASSLDVPDSDSLTVIRSGSNLNFAQSSNKLLFEGEPLNSSWVPIDNFLVNHQVATVDDVAYLEVSFDAGETIVGPVRFNLNF